MSQRRLFSAFLWLFLVLLTGVHANAVGYRRPASVRRPTVAAAAGDSVQIVPIRCNYFAVDPVTGMIYASLGSSEPNGNSIVRINPATLEVGPAVFIGSEPGRVAISDDGQYLYAALEGASQVRRMRLPSMTPDIQFPMLEGQQVGMDDIEVVPGQPQALMVTLRNFGLSPRSAGTAIYDDGVRRQNMSFWNNTHTISSDGQKAYLFHNETTGAGVTVYAINANGITAISGQSHLLNGFGIDGIFHEGLIYANNGYVWDPDANVLLGRYGNGGGNPTVDSLLNRVFYITGTDGNTRIRVYDRNTFLEIGTIPVPQTVGGQAIMQSLTDGGFVFKTPTQLIFVHSSFRSGPPAAPSSLTATLQTGGVQLAWQDNSNGEDGFRIERSTAAGPFGVIASVGANTTTYLNTALAPNTAYSYRVRAYNGAGNSAYSNTATVEPLPPVPAAPTNLTATVLSPSRVDLAWQDNSTNETGFEIERKTGNGSYSVIGAVGASLSSFSDPTAAELTTYTYRVRAVNLGGSSDYTNEAVGTTPTAPTAAPSNLTATALSSSEVRLSWQDNSTNETGFKIERKSTGAFVQIATPGTHAGTGTTTFSDLSGIAPDTTYVYQVRAAGAAGDSAYSNQVSVTIPGVPPAAPSGLTAVPASATMVNLSWQDNSTNESEFQLERKVGANPFVALGATGSNITTFADTAVAPQTAYIYRVRAVNGGGPSAYSDTATATTPAPPTAAPTNLVAGAVTNSEIRLSWLDNSGNETGFRVERRGPTGGFSLITTRTASVGTGKTITYSDTAGLTPNTSYTYRVRAYGPNGESDYSNEATATTAPAPPAAPSGLTATVTNTSTIRLTWTDNSANETGFRVERRIGGSGGFLFLGGTVAEVTLFVDPGLAPDTLYSYRVQATGTASNSDYSNVVDMPTAPKVPTGITVTAGAPGQLVVHWTDTSATESSFKLERKNGNVFTTAGSAAAGASSFVDTGRLPNTEYTYRVRAVNPGGESAPSLESTGLTLPAAPSELTVSTISAEILDLSWTDNNPSPPVVWVERSSDGGTNYLLAGETLEGSTTFRDTGLGPNVTYTYRIAARNASGASGYSGNATGTTLPAIPASPRNFTAAALTARAIRLTWEDNSANESGFEIYRRVPGGTTFDLLATAPANATSYLNTGLLGSSTYGYRIRAVNAGGASATSTTATATTPADLPGAPAAVNAVAVSDSQIQLTWIDTSNNETGFRIERKSGTGSFATLTTRGAGTTEHLDTGLAEGATYTYRVIALNDGGTSTPSDEASATTRPRAPSNLTAIPLSTRIELRWQDGSQVETGFRIERRSTGDFTVLTTVGAGVNAYVDTTPNTGVTYTYRVLATGVDGSSNYSNDASAATVAPNSQAKLVVSPRKISFGKVRLNAPRTKTVKLTNKGKEPVTVLVGLLATPFSVSPGGTHTLAPRASVTLTVTYRATTAGTSSGALRISSTDPRAQQVDVSLTGSAR